MIIGLIKCQVLHVVANVSLYLLDVSVGQNFAYFSTSVGISPPAVVKLEWAK